MASDTSFGRRGAAQTGTEVRVARVSRGQAIDATDTAVPETLLERMLRLPWRWAGFGIMLCLLAIYLTQPEPLKDIAKWTALALGVVAGVLNTRLAKEAMLKRAENALKSVPRT